MFLISLRKGKFGWKRKRSHTLHALNIEPCLSDCFCLWTTAEPCMCLWAVYVPLTKHRATHGQAVSLLSISSNRTWAQWGQGLCLLLLSEFQSLSYKCLLNLHMSMIPASVAITESQMRAWMRMLDALRIQDTGNVDLSAQAAFLYTVLLTGILRGWD